MSVFFSARELAEIAIQMEKNGVSFYDSLARDTHDGSVTAMYDHLAGQERQHLVTFEKILSGIEAPRVEDSPKGEELAYVQALASGKVFVSKKAASSARTGAEAARTGIDAEKDSILLYYELRELVKQADKVAVDRIIDEEKAHLVELTGLLGRLTAE